MERLRIVYITANLPYGSAEAFIVPEIRQLMREGHDVLLIPRSPTGRVVHGQELMKQSCCEALYSPRLFKAAAVTAWNAPHPAAAAARALLRSRSIGVAIKNFSVFPKALWLAEVVRRWKADHIHCHWATTSATMAMIASRISQVPWSLTAHRGDIVENNLLMEKAGSASFVRFISQDGLRLAKSIGIGTAENARVLKLGVAIPDRVRSRRSTKVVLCPARLSEVKGHRFLLESWRILQDRGIDAELWLAGEGELRARLENRARELSLRGVKFLGAIPHRELLSFYERAEVAAVALASVDLGGGLHEGIPASLIEAMSYGVPVVATTTGGTAELITPGSGILIPPENPVALADAIQLILADARLAEQMGASGRQRVVETHDIVRIAGDLATAFQRAAQKPAPLEPQFV